MDTITYAVEQNEKYGDYRIVQYCNGVWHNEFDDNWSEAQANERLARHYQGKTDFG